MQENKVFWIHSPKRVFTPGGDPLWCCPVCGKGEHVYGIETAYNKKDHCPNCHIALAYVEEKENNV